jgi:elongation factor P hydroxylase
MQQQHHYQQLIDLFDSCFAEEFNTRLIKGDDEPIYLPADDDTPYHRIVFAHGFFASALHEISHWCVAGKARRELVDFGYWYCPDGRDAMTQSQFEDVEVKPQALSGCSAWRRDFRLTSAVTIWKGTLSPIASPSSAGCMLR